MQADTTCFAERLSVALSFDNRQVETETTALLNGLLSSPNFLRLAYTKKYSYMLAAAMKVASLCV